MTMRFALPFVLLALAGTAAAQTPQSDSPAAPGAIEPDGTVHVPGFRLPPSIYLSEAAKKALPRTPTDPEEPMMRAVAAGQAGALRQRMPQLVAPRINALKAMYKVTTREEQIAGIPAVRAIPAAGVAPGNRRKILLNLPGGGFIMGVAGGTGMMESIPLAGLAGVEIVSITYRQAPETIWPAATEDVTKVYRELLKTYQPQDIGIFGCSAGGLLTAEAIAGFIHEKLPLPGAIGIFCASGDARWGGDSQSFARPFQALPPRDDVRAYFKGIDRSDPLVSPALSPTTLKQFPPTLLITGTRAFEMSATVNTHRELVKAGVDADLHMWDGLGHAFFYDPALPESREAFDVMTAFFRDRLKLAR
ncbi:alpha/beta hydrolase fold domain-containing protein [Sphingobium yanoikuyae]|jgi:acetyl esterase/lipase|uniref:Alpha/beta hydrolase n=1 Tax=Sphingobium yanoikuyae TaxID=13690 RepID=A0A430BQL4_SPHYA|nr:alpha/beta hydrolase fold domain-containing protein [Sphingobium yanoikuyae]RSU55024.1 alpha/beta hydrolase [Sphingobium yanoikuyae]